MTSTSDPPAIQSRHQPRRSAQPALRRAGRAQGPDQAGQGRRERPGLRARVPARDLLRLERPGDHRRRHEDRQDASWPRTTCGPTRPRRSSPPSGSGAGLKIIDKVTVTLNEKRDVYEALLSNLGTKGVEIPTGIVKQYEKLLAGGIWAIITHGVFLRGGSEGLAVHHRRAQADPDARTWTWRSCSRAGGTSPRSSGSTCCCGPAATSRPSSNKRAKWHLLCRMVPLVENNFNVCELGPRGNGQEPHLQGDQPQQHPDLRRADDCRQPVLQPGPPHGRAGRPVGRGGL